MEDRILFDIAFHSFENEVQYAVNYNIKLLTHSLKGYISHRENAEVRIWVPGVVVRKMMVRLVNIERFDMWFGFLESREQIFIEPESPTISTISLPRGSGWMHPSWTAVRINFT